MLQLLFLFLSIIVNSYIASNSEENIITFRRWSGRKTQNISTKYGKINLRFDSYYDNITDTYYAFYLIENIKNLNLFSFPDLNCSYEIFEKNNSNSLKITFPNEILNKYNNLITRLFYEIKYIDKMIYAIGYDGNYCKYLEYGLGNFIFRFYGGAPNRLTKNLIKYSFSPKDIVKEININYSNGTKLNIQIDQDKKENNLVEFNENNYFICFPEYILEQIKNLILKNFNVELSGIGLDDFLMYSINNSIFNILPDNFTFLIRNRIITITKEILSPDLRNYDLFIQYTPCEHFVFGHPFLRHVDMREYYLQTNETNVYVRKNNSIIIEEKEKEKEMKMNSFKYYFYIIGFIFISMMNIFIFWRKKMRNKNIEEYNKYYII